MARYKHYDYGQTKLLPISYERQILPGTFEHTLSYLIDHKIDLSVFEDRYQNDDTGAPAYDPALLLKIVLFAYAKGITSSRQIAALCREHVVFMALSADTTPHFTTIADFVASLGEQITRIFRDVLLVCDEAGLIGKEMFAVDGVKLSSNASKEWSGTQADLRQKTDKMQRAITHLLATHHDKLGKSGRPKQSNITDNDSAKMPTSKGLLQGYNGVAMVDAKAQANPKSVDHLSGRGRQVSFGVKASKQAQHYAVHGLDEGENR